MSKNQFENVKSKSDNNDDLFESDSESMCEEKEKIRKDQMKFCKLCMNGRVYNEAKKKKKSNWFKETFLTQFDFLSFTCHVDKTFVRLL